MCGALDSMTPSDRPSAVALALVAVIALVILAIIVAAVWTWRGMARDSALDEAAVDAYHQHGESAFQLAPETGPHRFRTCADCRAGRHCADGLAAWLAVPDEYSQARTALAADMAALHDIERRAQEGIERSADAVARVLGALCPLIWGEFDADHRPTSQLTPGFSSLTELYAYLALEATIHAPRPRPLSDLSDSHVTVDWDGELHSLLLSEVSA